VTDLLANDWIPVRPKEGGAPCRISLRTLLCGAGTVWQPHLPRDDMELALVQLLCALAQVCWMPKDKSAWLRRVQRPLSDADYQAGIAPYTDWFQLDHAQYPFMQVREVAAKEPTGMDKLLPGLDSSSNSCFVNQPGLATGLCGGCTAIALFNQSTQAPGFGGGFKQGLKGVGVSTLLRMADLRMTIWLNVLSDESLDRQGLQTWRELTNQKPTWIDPILSNSTFPAASIGLLRGLFWQPLHLRLGEPEGAGLCSCCGQHAERRYVRFDKAKFNFTVAGIWPHPYAPRMAVKKKGEIEERFVGFTTEAPSWTQLDRYVDALESEKQTESYKPAPVICQARDYVPQILHQPTLLVGGYRNNQAAIVERRLTPFSMAPGWLQHTPTIRNVVGRGLAYKSALRKTLFQTSQGINEVRSERQKKIKAGAKFKGVGLELQNRAEPDFFRRSTPIIERVLADIDFDNPLPTYIALHADLAWLCRTLFDEATAPYQHDLEMQETIALTRRILNKHLGELAPQNIQATGVSS
jgi:CRISPR system Cascade subunit CasA